MKRLYTALFAIALLALTSTAGAACPPTTNMALGNCTMATDRTTAYAAWIANFLLLDFNFVTPLSRSGVTVSLGTVPATKGGTGQSTWATGETPYTPSTDTIGKLAPNTTTTKKYRCQQGNGSVVTTDGWCTPTSADLSGSTITSLSQLDPALCLTGKIIKRGASVWECANDAGASGGGGTVPYGVNSGVAVDETVNESYMPLSGIGYAINAEDNVRWQSAAGTFKKIRCGADNTPGATSGDGWEIFVYGSSTLGDTATTCNLKGSTFNCTGTTESAAIPEWEDVAIHLHKTGTPNSGVKIRCATIFAPS